MFLHVLDWQDDLLPVPSAGLGKNSRFLNSGEPVKVTVVDDSILLHLPEAVRDPLDTVIVFDK